MNRDDIIRMAREAGFNKTGRAPAYYAMPEEIERFAALVAAAERAEMAKHCAEITRAAVTKAVDGAVALEREACAKVCEEQDTGQGLPHDRAVIECAAAIRAREQA